MCDGGDRWGRWGKQHPLTPKEKVSIRALRMPLIPERYLRTPESALLACEVEGLSSWSKGCSPRASRSPFETRRVVLARECKIARNTAPPEGRYRVQLRPLLMSCVSILSFGPEGPRKGLGDDWRGPDRPDTTRLF